MFALSLLKGMIRNPYSDLDQQAKMNICLNENNLLVICKLSDKRNCKMLKLILMLLSFIFGFLSKNMQMDSITANKILYNEKWKTVK